MWLSSSENDLIALNRQLDRRIKKTKECLSVLYVAILCCNGGLDKIFRRRKISFDVDSLLISKNRWLINCHHHKKVYSDESSS
jgi:hypothetical protein